MCLAACDGDQAGAPSAPPLAPIPPPPEPPRATGRRPSVWLVVGGSGKDVPIGAYFTVDPSHVEAVDVEVLSEDENVARARLNGTGLMSVVTVEPVGEGVVRIHVIVRTPAGSAELQILIDVLAVPTDSPQVVLEPTWSLVEGGSRREFFLGSFITTGDWNQDRATDVEAGSANENVVTVRLDGDGLAAIISVAPVGVGETTVVLAARNAAGSAVLRIRTTVVPAELPRLTGQIGPLTMVAGSRERLFGVDHSFEPRGLHLEARSLDESVMRAAVLPRTATDGISVGNSVSFTPVGPGETFVVITARNAAGSAVMTVGVTVLDKLRLGLASRAGPAGGPAVRLVEGSRWNVEIQPVVRKVSYLSHADVTIGIATDAPADELIVPESLTIESLVGNGRRVFFPIEAPADDTPGEPERDYTISLVSAEGLPSWAELSEEPLRVTVLDSLSANCEDLRVIPSLDRVSDGVRYGTFRIQAPHPDTALSWVEPYVNRTGSDPTWFGVAPHVFPERLLFRELRDGFEQEVRLRWWDGDLRWTIEAPGCEPIELHCDEFTCAVR